MRVAFAGTPEFAVPVLRELGRVHTIAGVLTQPDRPAGRGRKLRASPVREFAAARGWAVDQPRTLRSAEGRAALEAWQPELLVVVAYGLLLPRDVLAIPRLGCLNIHASLLPRWRGAAPIHRAILAGDAETGVSIMQMDEGLDTGAVHLERRVPIGADTTTGMLHDELAELGAVALLEVIAAIEAGTARPVPQAAEGATYAHKIDKAEALIDWREPADAIARRVRAFDPWPLAETRYAGEQLRILRARATAHPATGATPGTVLGLRDGALLVACGPDGSGAALAVETVQRPGRKPVTAREFVNAASLDAVVLGA